MRSVLRRIWEDKNGNALVLGAAALPLLLGSAGLATDTIQWALWKRQLQRAADSAAIAGVYERVDKAGATTSVEAAVNYDLTLNHHTGIALESGYPQVAYPANETGKANQVNVTLAVRRPLSFSSMFMSAAPQIRVSARAAAVSSAAEFCVLSLQENSKTGIQVTGNAEILMDCGWMTNSTSTNAAAGQGSSRITATTLAAAGGIQASRNWNVIAYQPYSPQLEDPYEDLNPDEDDFEDCDNSNPSLTVAGGNDGLVVSGGECYASISIQPNRTLTLKDGTYIVSGGGVNIQGTLNLLNATLILSNHNGNSPIGSLDMNATGQLNATAPTTGKWAGMALYQDRRAVDNAPTGNIQANSPNKINGNSTNKIQGVVYFPSQQVTYNGDGTGTATCTQFVAKRLYWSGNSGINNFTKNCPGMGIRPIVAPLKVRLVA